MAEAAPYVWTSKVLCRYYVHGACRQGKNCRYSHEWGDRPVTVCRYFLKGCCSYGEQCRYDHTRTDPITYQSKFRETPIKGRMLPPPYLSNDLQDEKTGMVTFSKNGSTPVKPLNASKSTPKSPEEWVKASEFVPGQPFVCSSIPSSYAKAAKTGCDEDPETPEEITRDDQVLCPFQAVGECPYDDNCVYIHGEICEYCGAAVLYPNNDLQNKEHKEECIKSHEKDMELSFAIARSKDKVCGVCMEEVMEKLPPSERRFGILSNCNHVFCVSCIRKWRTAKQFENDTIRCCPECRVKSDFITPSKYWVDTREEKETVIEGYKKALSTKPCHYFKKGKGDCPFNEKCFYLHALPDGSKADPKPRKTRTRTNADGDMDILKRPILWDFVEERENRLEILLSLHDLDSLLIDFITDSSEESDFDDNW